MLGAAEDPTDTPTDTSTFPGYSINLVVDRRKLGKSLLTKDHINEGIVALEDFKRVHLFDRYEYLLISG